jgi:hypothetical protein
MEVGLKLKKDLANIIADATSYRRLVGRLLYLTHTRPDIAFAVGRLSQFLSYPTKEHFNAAVRVLKYIKKSPGEGLFFSANSQLSLIGYRISDWGSCIEFCKSISNREDQEATNTIKKLL